MALKSCLLADKKAVLVDVRHNNSASKATIERAAGLVGRTFEETDKWVDGSLRYGEPATGDNDLLQYAMVKGGMTLQEAHQKWLAEQAQIVKTKKRKVAKGAVAASIRKKRGRLT